MLGEKKDGEVPIIYLNIYLLIWRQIKLQNKNADRRNSTGPMYYVQVELEYPSKNVRSTFFFVTNLQRHISTTRRRVY